MADKKKGASLPNNPLGDFEGRPVLGTAIKITNAGDGLSAALAVDPVIHHLDDDVYVVLKTKVSNVAHPPVKDTNGVSRMHTLKTIEATVVDGEMVADMLEAQRIRIEKARGIDRLPYDGPDADALTDEEIIGVD